MRADSTGHGHKPAGFTLLELLLAMALFAIAAVSLAGAVNMIAMAVAESRETSALRERLRSVMLEWSRRPDMSVVSRDTTPGEDGIFFQIQVREMTPETREGLTLNQLYEVSVTACRVVPGQAPEVLQSAFTVVYPAIY